MGALYKGLIATAVIAAVLIFFVTRLLFGADGLPLFGCAIVGLAVTGLIVWITEYYTSTGYRPVRSGGAVVGDGSCHERHPRLGRFDGGHRHTGHHRGRGHCRRVPVRRHLRHQRRRHHDVGLGRHGRCA